MAGKKVEVADQEQTMDRRCRYCDEPISHRAKVCYHCGRPQGIWKIHHFELLSLVNALVALGLLVLGTFQFSDAKKDRVDAEHALRTATRAVEAVERLVIVQKAERRAINSTFAQLFSNVCDAFQGTFDASSYSCLLPDGKSIKYKVAMDGSVE